MLLPSRLTCPLVPVLSTEKLQWLTWSRQLPFGPGICPYPASYARRLLKEAALVPRFPATFRPAGIRLLAIRSRRGSWSFLAVGLPGRTRTPTGFSRSARPETRPARVPSVPRGHGVLTADASSPAAVAASLRQALPPALRPISRGHCHEASDEGIACAHPSGLPLACGPRMERAPLGFSPDASDPAVASDARQGGDGSRTLLRSSLSSTSRSSNQ